MSKRISLAMIRDGKVCNSFNEGEYEGKGGIQRAINDAELSVS